MMNRSAVLAALHTSTLALAGGANANPTDPILEHYREWLDARAEWKRLSVLPGNENFDFPESLEQDNREDAALAAMVELTPTTPEGVAALLHVLWYFEVPDLDRNVLEYAEVVKDPAHKAILGLWRATTGTAMPLGT